MTKRETRLYSSWNSHIQQHWGRSTWDALFLLAADYPHAQMCTDDNPFTREEIRRRRRGWRQLLESLPEVLSCGECATHFDAYLRRDGGRPFRDALRDRERLFAWLHRCKDEVNRRTNRRSISLKRTQTKYIAPCDRGKARRARS